MINDFIYNSQIKPLRIPTKFVNYRVFSSMTTDYIAKQGEKVFPAIRQNLDSNKYVVESLYIVDRIQEHKFADCAQLYPSLSKYNQTKDPEIQTFLAGIYRKTQVPDAFGPLVVMLVQNAKNPPKTYFDPNEEIGGAILSYLA